MATRDRRYFESWVEIRSREIIPPPRSDLKHMFNTYVNELVLNVQETLKNIEKYSILNYEAAPSRVSDGA